MQSIKHYLSLVKFSHTIFAMPFAMVGFFLAMAEQHFAHWDWTLLLKVVLCMVFARTAAMAFNRYLDRDIDALNQRTTSREIPAGIITPQQGLLFVVLNCLVFVAVTWFINPLCFMLSPVALAVVLGYSYTKRFTSLCHFVLGIGLALAPIGAYVAVTGAFSLAPILYGMSVLTWVAGFDIIYALQDEQFDKSQKLHSIPVALGGRKALQLSSALHFITACCLGAAVWLTTQSAPTHVWMLYFGLGIFLSLLFWQHTLVKHDDLSRVNLAFFTTNGIASLIFGSLAVVSMLLG